MCASFFLSSVPSVPSYKMPASCLVRIAITHPDSCDKQQYNAELLQKLIKYQGFLFINLQLRDIMSVSEREQVKPAHRERRMSIMNGVRDIL